jgi:hypothetical protein
MFDCAQKERNLKGFESLIKNSAKGYNSSEIYYTAGNDFDFFSERRYLSLESLIKFYKDRPCKGIEVEYSGPMSYFNSTLEKKKKEESPV